MISIITQVNTTPEVTPIASKLQTLYRRIRNIFQRSAPVSPILTTNNLQSRPVFGRPFALQEYGRRRNEALDIAFRNQLNEFVPGTEETDSEHSF